ncbi:MAG TPA: hypothetical protein VNO32_17615 [Candidatus Acidoferrum sp.]|jgi:hypothetical protein|nr:hypothetical protein [Candidatus Acidoferrum sp.]
MSEPLAIYLQDHLAGASLAIELLKSMRDQHSGAPLGDFAATLLAEIEADHDVLRALAERTGSGSSAVKELGAWLTEKVSRVKLSRQSENDLKTFEALEFLQLGIHGKWALWRALDAVAARDVRLQGTDFAKLIARAEIQEAEVEHRRLEAARAAFSSAS